MGSHSTENSITRELEISGSGEPLVLLHGWAMNRMLWKQILPRLESCWQVYQINLPGHGGSAIATQNSDFDSWLQHILEYAPESATWLGWSLGGLFAIAAAARFPERVQRLILVATTPRFVQTDGWRAAGNASAWESFADNVRSEPQAANDQFLKMQALGTAKPMQVCKALKMLQQEGRSAHFEALISGLQMLQDVDLRFELSQLACPVQFILGEQDQLVPADVAADIQALLPACKIDILPKAGHVPFLSQTQRFLQVMQECKNRGL